jgi:hypothetical protein
MTDDLRKDHDPRPNAEERAWMNADFYGAVSRFVLVAGVAIMIGVSASVLTDRYATSPTMASAK